MINNFDFIILSETWKKSNIQIEGFKTVVANTMCNCCRVRYQFLLSISFCYVLVTPRYHMSKKPCALSPFAIVSFLDKRELIITKVIAKLILRLVYSGVTERTIGKRVFISLSFSLHFLTNCCIIRFPCARVFRYVFLLCCGYFSFNL